MSEIEKVIKEVDNAAFFASVKELLDEGREISFTVVGRSMFPMLHSRQDSVTIEKVSFEQLKKRDIILFSPMEGTYILHRIISLSDKGFTTAGDGNLFADGFFPKQTLVARVKAFERKGKQKKVSSLFWRFYGLVWVWLFPIRKFLLKNICRLAHLKENLFKK